MTREEILQFVLNDLNSSNISNQDLAKKLSDLMKPSHMIITFDEKDGFCITLWD